MLGIIIPNMRYSDINNLASIGLIMDVLTLPISMVVYMELMFLAMISHLD